ncbi:MAG TPA: FtsX-like permease family protein [Allosphingosinicella sp.]|nr:FtsX-like permease family protein [Allosphingosinicella sp.]
MRTLHVKLLRDLWRLRAQALAIALVIAAGVGMVVMSFGMIRSLESTREAYYDLYRFAHVWAPLRRAPESVMDQVRTLPGVAAAESRVSAVATLDVAGVEEPVAARIHSIPATGQPRVNALVLRSGRWPDPGRPDEVLANEVFAEAAQLRPGDRISAVLYGKQIRLRIVGTALSPEYVYAVAPGQIFPDNRRFGILWMGREALGAALDLNESFNEAVVRLAPGAREAEVIRRLDLLLARFGGAAAYGRDEQISHAFLSSELDQLQVTVQVLPPLFLAVAAFLLNIVLARLVDTEREVIGLLKAFGYRDRAIMIHYGQLAALLAFGGMVLGIALGAWLGRGLAGMYQRFYVFPFLDFRAGADVYAIAVGVTLIAVLVGASVAVLRAARLTPAEAMRPPAPPDFSGRLTKAIGAMSRLDQATRMMIRGLLRRPVRSLLSVAGLSAAMALYIASAGAMDNVERMIQLTFGLAEREDLTVAFAEPRDQRALVALARLPGVLRTEPYRVVPVRLRAGPRIERASITGAEPGADLSRLVDIEGEVVPLTAHGVLISDRLARLLDVGAGDELEAAVTEGQRPTLRLIVVGVVESPFGAGAIMERSALNRLLREGDVVSGAYLAVDRARLPEVYRALKRTPMVAGVAVQSANLEGLRRTIAENMGVITLFNTGFAAMIVFGVVYNSARISLSERARDLASLRVLGFRRGEVAFVLLGEQAVLLLLCLAPGLLMGIALARYMSEQFSSDLFTIPFAIDSGTLAQGVLVTAAAAAATAILIRLRVDKLDLVRALKTRE